MGKLLIKQNEQYNNKELMNINFVKTILMFIIIFYHCMCFVVIWKGSVFGEPLFIATPLVWISKYLARIHNRAFVIVAGYLFYYLKYEINRYKSYKRFFINKLRRLIVPWCFVSIVWALPFIAFIYKYSFVKIIESFMKGPSQLWFLVMLFLVFVLVYPLSKLWNKFKIGGALITIGIWLIGWFLQERTTIGGYFQISNTLMYLLAFYVGFCIRKYGSKLLMKIPAIVYIVVDIGLFLIANLIQPNNFFAKIVCYGSGYLHNIFGAVMLVVVLLKIANKVKWEESKVFRFFEKRSMPIYLFHEQFIYIVVLLLVETVNPYLITVINFVVALGGACIISTILMKFKTTRFLIGEK